MDSSDHRHKYYAQVQSLIDDYKRNHANPTVLEGGCGSLSHFDFSGTHITGIDISQGQLDHNEHLDDRILGDVETHPIPANSFDIVISCYVLEHLKRPQMAMANFKRALKPGGLMILFLPNVLSIEGMATKYTPHAFHIWIYRNLLDAPWAGTDHRGPFPTELKYGASSRSIRRFAREEGLEIFHQTRFMGGHMARISRKSKLFAGVVKGLGVLPLVTLGRIDPRLGTIAFVLRK